MSKLTYYGPVKASCKPYSDAIGLVFVKVGAAFKDAEGRLVIKMESIPLPHQNWNGYLNIYEADE